METLSIDRLGGSQRGMDSGFKDILDERHASYPDVRRYMGEMVAHRTFMLVSHSFSRSWVPLVGTSRYIDLCLHACFHTGACANDRRSGACRVGRRLHAAILGSR